METSSIIQLLNNLPKITYRKPKFKNVLEYIFLRLFSFFWKVLPLSLSKSILHFISRLITPIFKKRNKLATQHMIRALKCEPSQAAQYLIQSYQHFAENWLYLVRRNPTQYKNQLITPTFEGSNYVQNLEKEGKGLIIATGHLGHWERATEILDHFNFPSAIMAAVQHNPLADAFINQQREFRNHRIVHNRLGVRHMFRYLKSGGRLVIFSDVDIGGTGVFVPFLDQIASTPKWPAELSIRTGAHLAVGFSTIDDHGHDHLILKPPIDPNTIEGTHEEKVKVISTRMNDLLSEAIRERPGQWFWLQRRWKTPPR